MKLKPEDFNFTYTEWTRFIDEYIFSERDRSIMKRCLLDGITYERLAEEFELSVRQTFKIVDQCTIRLIKCMKIT